MKGESKETSSEPPAISPPTNTGTEQHVNKDSVQFVVHRELANERVVYKNEHHIQHFTQELIRQRKDGFLCDVVIEVDGQRYWAHRAILAAGSAYFHAAFNSTRPDNASGDATCQVQHLNLTTVDRASDRAAFEAVLYYIYTGDLLVSLATASDLITVAGQLGVADVKQCCEYHMRKIIDINNWLDVYKMCVTHNLEKLSTVVEDFIVTSFGVLAQEKQLLHLPESFLQNVLSRCNTERDIDIEGYILQVILKWVVHSAADRMDCLGKLLSIVKADNLSKDHIDKILACDAIRGHEILTQPVVAQLLKTVKENDEKQKLIKEDEERSILKAHVELEKQEVNQLTILEKDGKRSAENKIHKCPLSNSNRTKSPVATDATSVGSDRSRKRLPIKKREDRTSQQVVSVKEENISSEPVHVQENDSDTDTEWSEPLRKALLDLQQAKVKREAENNQVSTVQKSDTKKRDQYPPKKRRKYADHETGDIPYSKVAPIANDEKTGKGSAALPVATKTSARRKSSRPLKLLVTHRTTRTSQAAAKSVASMMRTTLKKPSKSVTTCTQTIEGTGDASLPSAGSLILEQKVNVKVENGLEPAPRKRRGRKPGK